MVLMPLESILISKFGGHVRNLPRLVLPNAQIILNIRLDHNLLSAYILKEAPDRIFDT